MNNRCLLRAPFSFFLLAVPYSFFLSAPPENIKDRAQIVGQLRRGDCLTILNSLNKETNCYQLAVQFLKRSSIERNSDLGARGDELGLFLCYHQQCTSLQNAFYPQTIDWPYSKRQNVWHPNSYNRHKKEERLGRKKWAFENCKHREKYPYDLIFSFKNQYLKGKIASTTVMKRAKRWDEFIDQGGFFFNRSGTSFTSYS